MNMNRVNIKQLFKNISAKLMQEFEETEKTLGFPPDRGGRSRGAGQFRSLRRPSGFGGQAK